MFGLIGTTPRTPRRHRSQAEICDEFNDILASISGEYCLSSSSYSEHDRHQDHQHEHDYENDDQVLDAKYLTGMNEDVFGGPQEAVSVESMLNSLEDFSIKEGIDVNMEDTLVIDGIEYDVECSQDDLSMPDEGNDEKTSSRNGDLTRERSRTQHSNNSVNVVPMNNKRFISDTVINHKYDSWDNISYNNNHDHMYSTIDRTNQNIHINNKSSQVSYTMTNFDFDIDALINGMSSMKNASYRTGSRKPLIDIRASSSTSTTPHTSIDYDGDDDEDSDSDVVLTFSVSSPYVMTTSDVKGRLQALHSEIWSTDEDKDEATIARAKKIKLALEKMEDTSFEKLFVKVYHKDQCSHQVMMIDKGWTARDVKNTMILKNTDHIDPSPNWCIVEMIPQLSLERIMEDSESVLDTVMDWSSETENILMFRKRRGKCILFNDPHHFLDISTQEGNVRQNKEQILKEFFSNYSTCTPRSEGNSWLRAAYAPKSEGILWLRAQGKKWTRYFFTMRPSGIYYNPKGKKISKKMTCLATYDSIRVYSGLGFHKKYQTPTNHVFCLKPSKVQDFKSKNIFLFCAEDSDSKTRWMCDIRLAKYGTTMYQDYLKSKEDEARMRRGWSTSSLGRL